LHINTSKYLAYKNARSFSFLSTLAYAELPQLEVEPPCVMGRASALYQLTILWELRKVFIPPSLSPMVIFNLIHSIPTSQCSLPPLMLPTTFVKILVIL
jgi:hypothetical protein